MRSKSFPRFKRPREKLIEKGPQALQNKELVAIILRTGYVGKSVLPFVNCLLIQYSLSELFSLSFSDLTKHKGIGSAKASVIMATKELSQRISQSAEIGTIQTPEDVIKSVNYLRQKKKEYLVGLYLNARNQLLKIETISIGTLTANIIHPREVFYPAIKLQAAQIIIVHNHPSNDPKPSKDDLTVTENLIKAGKLMGIDLVDHLIITKQNYFSFKEAGLFRL